MIELHPRGAQHIPERNRLAVGDEERLAGRRPGVGQQVLDREHVRVGDIGHVREVEQVDAGPDEEVGLALLDAGVDRRQEVGVARPEDGGRAQRACRERVAVGGEHEGFGFGLEDSDILYEFNVRTTGTIDTPNKRGEGDHKYFGLAVAQIRIPHRHVLVHVRMVPVVVGDDAVAARVHERRRARLLGRLEHVPRALDVDLEQSVAHHLSVSCLAVGHASGGVHDDGRAGLDDGLHCLGELRDVGLDVLDVCSVGLPVLRDRDVQHGDVVLRMLLRQSFHDARPDEAGAARDEDLFASH